MAKVKKNAIIEGLSGKVGNLVFRQFGNQTVVSKMPTHDPKRVPTPGEAAQRKRIQDSAALAKLILESEEGQAYYQAARQRLGKRSAYHTAIHDFFGKPEVLNVAVDDDGDYKLNIQVWDNVGVRKIRVQVDEESGFAEPQDEQPSNLWCYSLRGTGPWQVQIQAEDGMQRMGVWQGVVKLQDIDR